MATRGRSGRGRRRRGGKAAGKGAPPDQPLTLRVEELAPTGEGVGKVDDRAIFVPGTLPGELVLVQPTSQGRVRRGRLLSLVGASDDRVEPVCPHVERCGGCDWMHVAVQAQARHHLEAALRLLTHALGEEATADLPTAIHRPTEPLGYRHRARLSLRGTGGPARVGYLASRSHALAEVDSCAVLRPELEATIAPLGSWLQGSRGRGEAQVALAASTDRPDDFSPVLELRWQGELDAGAFGRIDAAVKEGRLAGARIWPEGARTPSDFGDPRPSIPGPDGRLMKLAPGGFGQASAEGGEALARRVRDLVRATRSDGGSVGRVVELFAGAGTLTLALVPETDRYEAVEQQTEAAEALRRNLRDRGLEAKVIAADAEQRPISPATRVVVLDPPRAGAAGACERILEARPRHVIYVSCNPVTLARDLTFLTRGGYVLRRIDSFELFPQTSHVELVASLERS